jgi:hypothetical protein
MITGSTKRAVAPGQMKLVSKDPSQDPISFFFDHNISHHCPAAKRDTLSDGNYGQLASEDSWEPQENFNDEQVVRNYWRHVSSRPWSHSAGSNVVAFDKPLSSKTDEEAATAQPTPEAFPDLSGVMTGSFPARPVRRCRFY